MTRKRAQLGDTHNFGRRVILRGGRVAKPRTVLWEWLFLSKESPFRRALDRAAHAERLPGVVRSGRESFAFLPTLKFFPSRHLGSVGGEVERIALRPLTGRSREARLELAEVLGRSLALWSWVGVADLHWENLALGSDARGRVVFGPLDVEMALADLSLPTETKLLPDADPEYAEICRHACGVRRALPWLGKPVDGTLVIAIASAYRETLAFLGRNAHQLAEALNGVQEVRRAPIRVCLRGTDEYVRARSSPLWPPLLDAEAEQIERGDIPYFFRVYGRAGIHYYADPSLSTTRRLPLRGDVPRLDPVLSLSRGLRSSSRKTLRNEGLLTVLGAFDDPTLAGRYSAGGMRVDFGKRTLVVRFADGEELHSRRNLSAFVSNVYLPCRCGEVRSVLVPKFTRCAV